MIITVHVLHLVSNWREALREAKRVLRPGGWLLIAYDQSAEENSAPDAPAQIPPPLQVRRKQTPDDIHAEAVQRLERWMEEACPTPDQPFAMTGWFMVLAAQWPPAPASEPHARD